MLHCHCPPASHSQEAVTLGGAVSWHQRRDHTPCHARASGEQNLTGDHLQHVTPLSCSRISCAWDWMSLDGAAPGLTMDREEDVIRRILGSWAPPALSIELPGLAKPCMRYEASRLRSFTLGAPCISPVELARAGFYHLGPEDRVQCFCCGLVLKSWEPQDSPRYEHRRFCSICPFMRGEEVGNVPQPQGSDSVDGQILGQFQRLPVEQEEEGVWQAVYPEMLEERERLTTFRAWPPNAEVSPDLLAKAGFFYTGHRDNVTCFHCDGGLSNWERGDDPWREHAKWFPRCEFLVRSMGQAYVHGVQESYFSSTDTSVSPDRPHVSVRSPTSLTGSPSDCQSCLQSSVVQSVLQMGFDRDLVLNLVQSRQRLTGPMYSSVSVLVTDLVQAEEEQSTQRAEPVTIPRAPEQRDPEVQHHKDPEPPLNTEEQLRQLKDERMCKVCMDKDASIVFVPCGHLVVCTDCSLNLRDCPICRAAIRGFVRAFLS
uniref:RING-type E3 ubiquitin transferase n=1 Tax=Leptobrachium leishanense TaxID=445787 RepID=A0A8C5PK55_9ANUR